MNNDSLFAPLPRRKRGLILTLSGSLLFHGSLIGVAAWWPTRPVIEDKPVVSVVDWIESAPPGNPAPPAVLPSEPALETPMLVVAETVDTPPPVVVPDADDMTLATPVPRPATRTVSSRPVVAPSMPRIAHASGSGPATGLVTGGGSGVGRPGAAGRWVTPRPAYPVALRMAHLQGSGSVRITTDAVGRVVSATIVKSTGNLRLDDHTCQAAQSEWSGPPNATTVVPISYQLQ